MYLEPYWFEILGAGTHPQLIETTYCLFRVPWLGPSMAFSSTLCSAHLLGVSCTHLPVKATGPQPMGYSTGHAAQDGCRSTLEHLGKSQERSPLGTQHSSSYFWTSELLHPHLSLVSFMGLGNNEATIKYSRLTVMQSPGLSAAKSATNL